MKRQAMGNRSIEAIAFLSRMKTPFTPYADRPSSPLGLLSD
jgi:hypothetical protein